MSTSQAGFQGPFLKFPLQISIERLKNFEEVAKHKAFQSSESKHILIEHIFTVILSYKLAA